MPALTDPHSSVGNSMLGRVFDAYQNLMQIGRCVLEAARQRGIARPRLLELSRQATGLAEYFPQIEVVRFPTHVQDEPALSPPVTLPFADGAFDACLVTDAYEHMAPALRPQLLAEMVRVAHGIVLLGCPVDSEITTRFDKVVFDFIWGKYAERFVPLDQHVEFGLEPLADVLASLMASGATRAIALPDNYVYRWIHQILIYFDLQHRHPHGDEFASLNAIYNARLAAADYREPCYRYLIVGATVPGLELDRFEAALLSRPATPAHVAATEGLLIEEWHAIEGRLADRLRVAWSEIERLTAELARAQAQVQALTMAQNSGRAWRLVGFLRILRRRLWPWGHPPRA